MRQAFLLIFVMVLLIDLGQDGCLGKAVLVPPDFSANTSLASPAPGDAGKIDSHSTLPSPDAREMPSQWQSQPVALRVQPGLKIIACNHTGSSGGIPL
jgi:hypothetical protein